jgi:hypothetical protein
VTGGLASNPTRWRTFADAVAMALGLNVWISVVLLPGVFVGAWASGASLAAAVLPVIVLGLGLWRRSDTILLLGYPSALLVPAAFYPDIVATHVYGPVRFLIVAIIGQLSRDQIELFIPLYMKAFPNQAVVERRDLTTVLTEQNLRPDRLRTETRAKLRRMPTCSARRSCRRSTSRPPRSACARCRRRSSPRRSDGDAAPACTPGSR